MADVPSSVAFVIGADDVQCGETGHVFDGKQCIGNQLLFITLWAIFVVTEWPRQFHEQRRRYHGVGSEPKCESRLSLVDAVR